jgi:putative phosphoribosyl transferase
MKTSPVQVLEARPLHNVVRVFADRIEAGHVLARLLGNIASPDALVLGIPAGGVPVAKVIADDLYLQLGVSIAKKMLLPGNTECGFGGVAFDGSEWINQEMVHYYHLSEEQVEYSRQQARCKVQDRLQALCGGQYPAVKDREVIVVDDGLASGATLYPTLEALKKLQPKKLIVAVPTASQHSALEMAPLCDLLVCANLREGYPYAVAAAYRHWDDVGDEVLPSLLKRHLN